MRPAYRRVSCVGLGKMVLGLTDLIKTAENKIVISRYAYIHTEKKYVIKPKNYKNVLTKYKLYCIIFNDKTNIVVLK